MKTQRILESKDITKIRKTRDKVWDLYKRLSSDDGILIVDAEDGLMDIKRMLDELLMEAKG